MCSWKGSSMLMASFGFMIYAISPAYSNSEKEKTEIKNTGIPNAPVGANGLQMGDAVIFIDDWKQSNTIKSSYINPCRYSIFISKVCKT